MATKPSAIPSFTLHKPSGLARVRIQGRDIYLGGHGTPEAEASVTWQRSQVRVLLRPFAKARFFVTAVPVRPRPSTVVTFQDRSTLRKCATIASFSALPRGANRSPDPPSSPLRSR